MNLEEMSKDYDWVSAFQETDLSIDRVEELLFESEGDNDGPSWICAGKLKSGQYFYLTA